MCVRHSCYDLKFVKSEILTLNRRLGRIGGVLSTTTEMVDRQWRDPVGHTVTSVVYAGPPRRSQLITYRRYTTS